MSRRLGIVLLWSLALVCASVAAQESLDGHHRALLGEPKGVPLAGEELARATAELTALIRCPVCQALSVAASSTPSAVAMEAKAKDLLALGYDEEQVLAYFESSYGEFIRLMPRAEGFNMTVWILPLAALILGGVLVWQRLDRRGARQAGAAADAEDSDLEGYLEQVRREVE